MEPPPGDPSNPEIMRDEIIDSYIKTLAQVVGRYRWSHFPLVQSCFALLNC
jgi:hypothetical protein